MFMSASKSFHLEVLKGKIVIDPIIHIGENSPEQIAFKLLEKIAKVEKKHLSEPMGTMAYGWSMADREWILKTYGQ
jgi:hypothetical protein